MTAAAPHLVAAAAGAPEFHAIGLDHRASGARLRNGFSLSIGQEFGTSSFDKDYSGQLYGVDWRIGAQVSDAITNMFFLVTTATVVSAAQVFAFRGAYEQVVNQIKLGEYTETPVPLRSNP